MLAQGTVWTSCRRAREVSSCAVVWFARRPAWRDGNGDGGQGGELAGGWRRKTPPALCRTGREVYVVGLGVPNGTRSARRRSWGAERDAQRAPSVLMLREVAHMSEMRKIAAFLWERHALEEVGFWLRRHTEPRVSDGMPPSHMAR